MVEEVYTQEPFVLVLPLHSFTCLYVLTLSPGGRVNDRGSRQSLFVSLLRRQGEEGDKEREVGQSFSCLGRRRGYDDDAGRGHRGRGSGRKVPVPLSVRRSSEGITNPTLTSTSGTLIGAFGETLWGNSGERRAGSRRSCLERPRRRTSYNDPSTRREVTTSRSCPGISTLRSSPLRSS